MDTNFFTLASFVVITSFTPGPNNISSASMGILYGYKKTLNYLAGIVTGFFLVMIVCGWISATLREILPSFESILRLIGAIYILWLAYHTFRASYAFDESQQARLGFVNGFFLQLLNPKSIVYALTLYSTFLGGKISEVLPLFLSALALATVGFCAVSTWTLFGASIRAYLKRPRLNQFINTALALLLVYTAIELSGVLDFLNG